MRRALSTSGAELVRSVCRALAAASAVAKYLDLPLLVSRQGFEVRQLWINERPLKHDLELHGAPRSRHASPGW